VDSVVHYALYIGTIGSLMCWNGEEGGSVLLICFGFDY
jgi:hypothetical protein